MHCAGKFADMISFPFRTNSSCPHHVMLHLAFCQNALGQNDLVIRF